MVVQANKGARMVILSGTSYRNKVNEFINKNQYIEVNKNPLKSMINNTNDVIRKTSETLKHFGHMAYNIKNKNPQMYSQIKLHTKKDMPIRPVVAAYTSPTAKLDRAITDIITGNLAYMPKYTNSYELTKELIYKKKFRDFRDGKRSRKEFKALKSLTFASLMKVINGRSVL